MAVEGMHLWWGRGRLEGGDKDGGLTTGWGWGDWWSWVVQTRVEFLLEQVDGAMEVQE